VAYAFVLGFFVYHEIKLADLPGIIVESVIGTGSICIIIAAAQPFGWVMAYEQAPLHLVAYIEKLDLAQWQLLVAFNIAILIAGCFMEGLAIMIMVTPMIIPLFVNAGVDLMHLGVVFTLNIGIGNLTPPVGMIMYTVCALGKISIWEFSREVWPFIIALVISLVIVTYLPILSTWLPDTLLPAK
jgi:tripartite ATP-independent transporter DctM subunit